MLTGFWGHCQTAKQDNLQRPEPAHPMVSEALHYVRALLATDGSVHGERHEPRGLKQGVIH